MKVHPLKLWIRMVRARRQMRRAQAELRTQKEFYENEREILRSRYERALSIERANNSRMVKEMCDRVLQAHQLNPILITDIEKDHTVIDHIQKEEPTPAEEQLTYYQHQLYLDKKDQFWEDGLEQGKSEQEISNRWREIEPEVLSSITNEIIS